MGSKVKRPGARTRLRIFLRGVIGLRPEYVVANHQTWVGDGFMTMHSTEHLYARALDSAFAKALDGLPIDFEDIRWRAHICAWAANQGRLTGGDLVECGVWFGVLSKTIAEIVGHDLNDLQRVWLIDAWGEHPVKPPKPEYQEDIFEVVQERFKEYPFVTLVRGHIPGVLQQIPRVPIGYLAIDLNSASAELQALEHFWPYLLPGAVVYLDDFGFGQGFQELRTKILDFLADKGEQALVLPNGPAIIVKANPLMSKR